MMFKKGIITLYTLWHMNSLKTKSCIKHVTLYMIIRGPLYQGVRYLTIANNKGENHVAPSLPPRDTYIHPFQMILSLSLSPSLSLSLS